MKAPVLKLTLRCAPLVAALVLCACSSTEVSSRPGSPTGYWGSGQPDQEAATNWVTNVGYRNQSGQLGDRYGKPTPPPPPPPPAPAPAPAPRPAPAPAPVMADMSKCTMAFPTGDRATSVILLECMTPAEVRVGVPYDYEMRVTNLTNMTVEDVTVTDMMQGNYTMSASNPPAARAAGAEAVWTLGRFNPGETKVIRATGTAQSAGAVTRCTKVTYNSQCCVTTKVVSPALQLRKAGPAEVLACDPIEYTFTVSNTGSGAARGVRIEDQLPAGLTTMDGKNAFVIDAGTLEAGQSRDFKMQVKAAQVGRYENTAVAKAEGGLEARSNPVATQVKNCQLVITKTAPDKRFIGRPIEYEITVQNRGDADARDCMIEDTLPQGVRFVSASDGGAEAGGKVTWRLGTLAPGASKKVMCTVVSTTDGTFRNVASVRAYCCPPASAEATTQVQGVPAILLEVVDNPDPIEIGAEVVYTITVTNQGTAVDRNILVTVGLEAAHGFVAGGGATQVAGAPSTAGGGTFSFQPYASLAPKQVITWTVRVKALQPGDHRFKITLDSDAIDRPVEETESTHFY